MSVFEKPIRNAVLLGAALVTLSSTAVAQTYTRVSEGHSGARYDYARVIDSRPIVREVRVERPVRECWQETQTRRLHPRRGNVGGAVAGSVVGGVIGHQFGSGRGNDAATIVGALLGAAIGSGARDERRGYATESYPVERCDTRYETTVEERIEGYDVTYSYNGQTLRTRLPTEPGDRIRVRVSVAPVR